MKRWFNVFWAVVATIAFAAVTNEAGLYRFPAVPPGEYRLAYELAGFQANVRDGIRITLGFNAQVNVTLNVAT